MGWLLTINYNEYDNFLFIVACKKYIYLLKIIVDI